VRSSCSALARSSRGRRTKPRSGIVSAAKTPNAEVSTPPATTASERSALAIATLAPIPSSPPT
jgi:hypothetical protein